jgi:hypothetical protein
MGPRPPPDSGGMSEAVKNHVLRMDISMHDVIGAISNYKVNARLAAAHDTTHCGSDKARDDGYRAVEKAEAALRDAMRSLIDEYAVPQT